MHPIPPLFCFFLIPSQELRKHTRGKTEMPVFRKSSKNRECNSNVLLPLTDWNEWMYESMRSEWVNEWMEGWWWDRERERDFGCVETGRRREWKIEWTRFEFSMKFPHLFCVCDVLYVYISLSPSLLSVSHLWCMALLFVVVASIWLRQSNRMHTHTQSTEIEPAIERENV